jgi:hypothetical protein
MTKQYKPADAVAHIKETIEKESDRIMGFMVFLELEPHEEEHESEFGTFFYGFSPADAVYLMEQMKNRVMFGSAGETLN